ncbi:efflux RND transporter periplasmic adaptor subunit [Acanthopleuribacter pedis]|uniref:Efflux RND transporter periplasmic adaptor subunit n=1 Tax=Acanthopleuribacter pedis TaxID=442870 RepID=A0A8J7QKK4_9BACT|nr:efflux RND transporter periplasmic adaptor subunit [Acanthopleuribacter pedis]MBO1322736.1 efflux RND transporter periplasmic adaptor subunit [Acanthopleuribacter pedis]
MSVEKAKLDALRLDDQAWRPKRNWTPIIAVVILVAVLAALFLGKPPGETETAATNKVTTGSVRQLKAADDDTVLNASGYVTARRQATVSAKITGKVTTVRIEEGMTVEEGQILATLEDVNLAAAFNLQTAQRDAARVALEETKVRIEEADIDYRRAKNLLANLAGDQATVDAARTTWRALKAQLLRQEQEVVVAERQVAVAQQNLDDTVIRAPFAGVVVSKDAQPGEMISPVSAGGGFTRTGIGTLVDMASLEIEVDVNEAYINRVQAEQPVEAILDAYPDWQIPAYVIAIVPTADRQRATVRVRVGFRERDPRVLPDMAVKVSFLNQEESEQTGPQLVVSRRAVVQRDDTDVVFLYDDGIAVQRKVTLGEKRGGDIIINKGLNAGETVILSPPDSLVDGAEVEVDAS